MAITCELRLATNTDKPTASVIVTLKEHWSRQQLIMVRLSLLFLREPHINYFQIRYQLKTLPVRLTSVLLCLALFGCSKPNSRDNQQHGQAATPLVAAHATTADEAIPTGQLDQAVQPLHYRIELTLLPDQAEFSGWVEIDLEILAELDQFYLHGRFLKVNNATLTTSTGQQLEVDYEQVHDSGVARISLPEAISGKATLRLDYSAAFNQSLSAAYTVKTHDSAYVFTQFEAISAREAFPGFDEPAFKVPFDLTLIIRQSHTAIANTPQTGTEPLSDGLKRIHFATTKPLPTYLLAFAVGEFDVVEAEPLPPSRVRARSLPLRAITVKGKGEQAQFALQYTRGIVEALESYFDIPYPYAKLDLLAVPDFAAGAMENAGAITYRDSIMLVAAEATPQIKRNFYRIHAHELAHQWFGDLVTPGWWDDIWLNEAFATWMAYVALDIWRPDDLYRRDLGSRGIRVMGADSKISARQIRQPILSNHDISNAFDGITYSKGAVVLSMYESLLGREAFRRGVQIYLRKHAWGNATADDFIDALAAEASHHQPAAIAASFRSFLEQAGLPLVQAQLQCEADSNQILLSQSRYLPLGSQGSKTQTWQIPVCLQTGTKGASRTEISKTCVLLTQAKQTFDLPAGQCPDFVMPNADNAGYYRWSLDTEGWRQLLSNDQALGVEEMMSLTASLDGAFNAGKIDITSYMDIAQRLAGHDNWRIATAAMGQLQFIYERIAAEQQRVQLRRQFSELYSGTLDRVGLVSPNGNEMALLQAKTVDFLSFYARVPELREDLKSMAYAYTGFPDAPGLYPDRVNSSLIGTALAVAIQDEAQDSHFHQHLLTLALASDDAVFRNRALFALAHTMHPQRQNELWKLLLSPQLRDNEIYNIIFPQMQTETTREAAWAWLQKNLGAVLERVPDGRKGRMTSLGQVFCDLKHRHEVDAFFGPKSQALAGGPRSLASTLESIDLCMAKATHHTRGLAAFVNLNH